MSKPVDTVSVPTGKGTMINAAIWENEVQNAERTYTAYSVTIEKRYRDDEGWKTSKSFKTSELLEVAFAAEEAYKRALNLRQAANRNAA